MSDKIIDGKLISSEIREKVKKFGSQLKSKTGKVPGLAVVLVGENPASRVYVKNKIENNYLTSNANDQKEMDQEIRNIDAISNFGTGLGGLVSPSKTTKNISSMKIGSYISGRSFQGSDGKN